MAGESKAGDSASVSQMGSDPAFERLADRIFKSVLEFDPVRASWLGIHGKNDTLLPDRSAEAMEAEISAWRELVKDLEVVDPRRLSPAQSLDLSLARGFLVGRIALQEKRPSWRLMPQTYVEDAVSGLYVLILRQYAPPAVRARALLARLKGIPLLLRQARRNLEQPPAIFTQSAVLAAQGAGGFFRRSMADFLPRVEEAGLRLQCERAASEALRSLEEYAEFLVGAVMPRSAGEFRVGKAVFNRILREEHKIPFDADELVVIGEKVYHETLRDVRRVAARIRPGFNWSRLLLELKEEHPQEQELTGAYASAVAAARRFVIEKGLLGVPEGESVEVTPTPDFARPTYPYAGYIPPGPFEAGKVGTFWVTGVDPVDSPDRRLAILRGHAIHGIPVLALHEAYPGHHLQFVRANQVDRKLRALFTTPVLVEGWALYCEEMMYREGFYADDRVRLFQLRDQLWRACRVIVDVGLHTGKMSFNDAVAFLVRKAKLERSNAVGEVRRYCAAPTQPMSYILGKLLIEELRGDYHAHHGDDYSQRKFHDELLGEGGVPVELIRRAMNVPRRAGEKEILRTLTRTPRPLRGKHRRRRAPEPT